MCDVRSPDYAAFEAMNQTGLLLLIFDGFDEMVVRADEDVIRRNLAAIEQFANQPNAKVLLTSRPEFFRNIQEEKQLFIEQDSLRTRPIYERYALLPMTTNQIETYLQRRIPLVKRKANPLNRGHITEIASGIFQVLKIWRDDCVTGNDCKNIAGFD